MHEVTGFLELKKMLHLRSAQAWLKGIDHHCICRTVIKSVPFSEIENVYILKLSKEEFSMTVLPYIGP